MSGDRENSVKGIRRDIFKVTDRDNLGHSLQAV